MAPGPMGQCFPIPDDGDIKRQMITTAENQRKIYRMYNFDYVTQVNALPVVRSCISLLVQHHKACAGITNLLLCLFDNADETAW